MRHTTSRPGDIALTPASLRDYHKRFGIQRRGEIVGREEYLDYMTFRRRARPMFTEIFGPLVGLPEEWTEQGATPEELDFSAFRFRYHEPGGVPVSTGFFGGTDEQILEETGDFVVARDAMGRTVKLAKRAASIPLPMDWPVKTMDDWRRFKHHYEFTEERFGDNWQQIARDHLAAGRVVTVSIPGGYDQPRQLLGDEGLCLAVYQQPELIEDILRTIGDTAEKVLDRVSSQVQLDVLSVHEDMAGRSGPLFGPAQIERFIAPYYRRIWDRLAARGARLFDQDSDGNMNPVIPAFLDAGLNCMHPCEPAADMDLVQIRRQYGPRLALVGGLDKHVLRRGREAIDAELERKIPPLVATGGAVFGLDHRIPNGTPLDAYRYYIKRAWDIIDRECRNLGL